MELEVTTRKEGNKAKTWECKLDHLQVSILHYFRSSPSTFFNQKQVGGKVFIPPCSFTGASFPQFMNLLSKFTVTAPSTRTNIASIILKHHRMYQLKIYKMISGFRNYRDITALMSGSLQVNCI